MAEEHFNRRFPGLVPYASQLPQGFNVTVELQDTSSTPSVGIEHAVRWSSEGFAGIVGAPRSAVSQPVALVASIESLPVVSYWSSAASLSDKALYPTFTRVIPPDAVLAEALIRVCKELNWNRLAVIHIDDPYGSGYAQDVARAAAANDMQVGIAARFSSGIVDQTQQAVDAVAESMAKIIVVISFVDDMETIIMRANEKGMFESGYVWIMADAILDPMEIIDAFPSNQLLPGLLQGWLGILTDPLYEERGETFKRVWDGENASYASWVQYLNTQTNINASVSDLEGSCELCGYAYDAFWTLGIALSKSISSDGQSIANSDTVSNIRPSSFIGSTGQVVLSETGDREAQGLTIILRNWVPQLEESKVEIGIWTTETGLQLRRDTATPFWVGRPVPSWETPPDPSNCEPGTVFNTTRQGCVACPRGTYQDLLECKLCPKGSYGPVEGIVRCTPCLEGFADAEGTVTCSSCPQNTRQEVGAAGLEQEECICKEGYWRPDGKTGGGCVACPEGGFCRGGPQQLLPVGRDGYWAATEEKSDGEIILAGFPWAAKEDLEDEHQGFHDLPKIFHECGFLENCLSPNSTEQSMLIKCKEGQTGYQCQSCDDGYAAIGSFCVQCPGRVGSWAMTIFGTVLVFLFWLTLLHYAGKYNIIDVALLYIQCVSITTNFAIPWPFSIRYVTQFLRLMTFQVDFVSPACVGHWDPVSSVIFQLLFPLVLGFIMGGGVIVSWLWFKFVGKSSLFGITLPFMVTTAEEVEANYYFAGMKLAKGLKKTYAAFCLKLFTAFNCVPIANGESWVIGTTVVCGSSKHDTMLALAVCGCIFYVVGIPATFAGLLVWMRRNDSLTLRSHQAKFGFLYLRYKPGRWWWELMIFARRFTLCLISVYASTTPHFQLSVGLCLIIFFLCTLFLGNPYWDDTVEELEYVGLASVALYMVAGFVFTSENFQQEQVGPVVGILLAITAGILSLALYRFYLSSQNMTMAGKVNRTIKDITAGAWMKTILEIRSRFASWDDCLEAMGVTDEDLQSDSLTLAHLNKLTGDSQSQTAQMFGPGLNRLLFSLLPKDEEGNCSIHRFKKAFNDFPHESRILDANLHLNQYNFHNKILPDEDLRLVEKCGVPENNQVPTSIWGRFSKSPSAAGRSASLGGFGRADSTESGASVDKSPKAGGMQRSQSTRFGLMGSMSFTHIFSSAQKGEKEWWLNKMSDRKLNNIAVHKVFHIALVHHWIRKQLKTKQWSSIIGVSLINSWLADVLVPTSDAGPYSYSGTADLYRKISSLPLLIDWLLDEEVFQALLKGGFDEVCLAKQAHHPENNKEVWRLVTPQFRPQFLFWLTNKSTHVQRLLVRRFLYDVLGEALTVLSPSDIGTLLRSSSIYSRSSNSMLRTSSSIHSSLLRKKTDEENPDSRPFFASALAHSHELNEAPRTLSPGSGDISVGIADRLRGNGLSEVSVSAEVLLVPLQQMNGRDSTGRAFGQA